MQAKQARNFVFVGDKDLVDQVIGSFSEQVSVTEPEIPKIPDSFVTRSFSKGKKSVSIHGCYEGSCSPTSNELREKFFKAGPNAVFFVLKAPGLFDGLKSRDIRSLNSTFEYYLRQAYDDKLPTDTPIFLILTNVSVANHLTIHGKLFQSVHAKSQSRADNKTFYAFKEVNSQQFFRGVFYCPGTNEQLFDLIWEGKDDNELQRIQYQVTKTKVAPFSSDKNSTITSSAALSPKTSASTSVKKISVSSGRNTNEDENVYYIDILRKEEHRSDNDNNTVSSTPKSSKEAKKEKEEKKTPSESAPDPSINKGSGTGLGSDTINNNKSTHSFIAAPISHALKYAAVRSLILLVFIALGAFIAEVAFKGLLFSSAPGGVLFDLIAPTFFAALGPIGAFALALGVGIILVTAATALYDYYQNTHSQHLEIAGKMAIGVLVLGGMSAIISDTILGGTLFAVGPQGILYSSLAGTVFASTPPAWFLMLFCMSVLLIMTVVGAAAAGAVSAASDETLWPRSQLSEDIEKTKKGQAQIKSRVENVERTINPNSPYRQILGKEKEGSPASPSVTSTPPSTTAATTTATTTASVASVTSQNPDLKPQ